MSLLPVFGDRQHPLAQALEQLMQRKLLLMIPGWLPGPICQNWLAQLQACPSEPALSHDSYVSWAQQDTVFRRTQELQPPKALSLALLQRLEPMAPVFAGHFGHCPGLREQPEFLHYRPGDYFRAHRDWNDAPIYRQRRLSLVLFLNDFTTDPGYTGGILNLFVRNREAQLQPIPIPPAAGLLIAFDSRLVHEVSPIHTGNRYTVVTWLADPA